jgi:hypothetical protein
MKRKDVAGQHDEVVNTLLDLQPVHTEAQPEVHTAFAPVTKLPTAGNADDRITAITERVSRLESELSGVMTKIEDAREERIADRVVQLEQRLLHEIASQRAEMVTAIESGFERLGATISEAWREAVHGNTDHA